jgi:hypothetical protein
VALSGSPAGPVDMTQSSTTGINAEDSTTRFGPENLWDRAYESLKMNDPDLVQAYEKILSLESVGNGGSSAAANN